MSRIVSVTLAVILLLLLPAAPALAAGPGDFKCARNADGSVTIRWSGGEEGETLAISRLDGAGRRLGAAVTVEQAKGEFTDRTAPAGRFYYEVSWGPLGRSALFLAVPGVSEGNQVRQLSMGRS